MMKVLGFLFVLLFIGTTAFVYIGYSNNGCSALNPGMVLAGTRNTLILTTKRRKLKENMDYPKKDDVGNVDLEDYRPIDPIPSSTASLKPGPIQHGTPLMPYIPEPSPPLPYIPGPSPSMPYIQERSPPPS